MIVMYIIIIVNFILTISPFFRSFLFFIVNIFIFYLFNFCMAEEPPRGSYTIKYVCMYVCISSPEVEPAVSEPERLTRSLKDMICKQ